MLPVDVGQIVYILDSKGHALVPGCIYERVVSKTLEGENTHHVVKFNDSKSTILEKLTAPWFVDADGARQYLLDEASGMIDQIVQRAIQAASESFPGQASSLNTLAISPPRDEGPLDSKPGVLKVDLGDGLKANVQLPEILK